MSHMSVMKAARLAGLTAYKRPTKPVLNAAHKARRLRFAAKYRRLNWRQVLFSDEKTFELFARPHNQYIWSKSAADVPANPTVKHPPKLHVWGGMSYYGKTELYFFTGNTDALFYKGILKERLLPDARRIFGNRPWILQQDGDPKHNSGLVQGWLRKHVRFIAKGDWPANSPDLNPMENLWAYLQQRVYARAADSGGTAADHPGVGCYPDRTTASSCKLYATPPCCCPVPSGWQHLILRYSVCGLYTIVRCPSVSRG